MELVRDAAGDPAPRLNDLEIGAEQAREWHAFMIGQIVRMLCAGLIHGDLSEFNVLLDTNGPVIIDLPQAVNAASNNNAFAMLARDVNNMRSCFGRAAPELLETQYAHELWGLFQAGELTVDSRLTGRFTQDSTAPDVQAVLDQIEDERREALLADLPGGGGSRLRRASSNSVRRLAAALELDLNRRVAHVE